MRALVLGLALSVTAVVVGGLIRNVLVGKGVPDPDATPKPPQDDPEWRQT